LESSTDSDVRYKKYLANGKTVNSPNIVSGINFQKPIRYRVINGGGMTNFQIIFPFEVTLVAADGQWVNPYSNTTFWVSVAQRMDFLIQVPANYNSSSIFITAWSENFIKSVPAPIVLTSFNSISDEEENSILKELQEFVSDTYATGMMNNFLNYELRSFIGLEQKNIDNSQVILLTGDNGFRGLNHHSYRLPPTAPTFEQNPYPILVNYGQRVELNIQNENPDGHPMHLHGHQFQVTNVDGTEIENGVVRDVVFVPGGCHNVTIQFDAVNPGVWAFHCHLEFHLAAGMLTTIEYQE